MPDSPLHKPFGPKETLFLIAAGLVAIGVGVVHYLTTFGAAELAEVFALTKWAWVGMLAVVGLFALASWLGPRVRMAVQGVLVLGMLAFSMAGALHDGDLATPLFMAAPALILGRRLFQEVRAQQAA